MLRLTLREVAIESIQGFICAGNNRRFGEIVRSLSLEKGGSVQLDGLIAGRGQLVECGEIFDGKRIFGHYVFLVFEQYDAFVKARKVFSE